MNWALTETDLIADYARLHGPLDDDTFDIAAIEAKTNLQLATQGDHKARRHLFAVAGSIAKHQRTQLVERLEQLTEHIDTRQDFQLAIAALIDLINTQIELTVNDTGAVWSSTELHNAIVTVEQLETRLGQ